MATRHEQDPFRGKSLRALMGPTAAGKSALALEVAARAGAEILSLDSMQVYRGMDIGTAKPQRAELERVPHHLIDLVEPSERFDVTHYLTHAARASERIEARGGRAFFVGGTSFYWAALSRGLFAGPPVDLELRARVEDEFEQRGGEALMAELERIDPRSAERVHANDRKRVVRAIEVFRQTGRPLSDWQREWGWHGAAESERETRVVVLDETVETLDARIEARARAMLDAGWVDEALRVRRGPGFGATAIQALGYAEALQLADEAITREACLERIVLRTRQFARRQRTWLRKVEGPRIRAALRDSVSAVLAAFGWDQST